MVKAAAKKKPIARKTCPEICPFCSKPTKIVDAPGASHPKCRLAALNGNHEVILVDSAPNIGRAAFPVTARLIITLGKERLYLDVRKLLKDGSSVLEISNGGKTSSGLVIHPINHSTVRVSVESFEE